jgi:hypothetical protein
VRLFPIAIGTTLLSSSEALIGHCDQQAKEEFNILFDIHHPLLSIFFLITNPAAFTFEGIKNILTESP